MPLQFWKKWTKTKKMTPLEIDVSNAIGHYNEAVDEDDKRNFRNALHIFFATEPTMNCEAISSQSEQYGQLYIVDFRKPTK